MMQETFWNQMCSTLPHTYVNKCAYLKVSQYVKKESLWSKISCTRVIIQNYSRKSIQLGPTVCATPISVMRQFPLPNGVLLMIAIR